MLCKQCYVKEVEMSGVQQESLLYDAFGRHLAITWVQLQVHVLDRLWKLPRTAFIFLFLSQT